MTTVKGVRTFTPNKSSYYTANIRMNSVPLTKNFKTFEEAVAHRKKWEAIKLAYLERGTLSTFKEMTIPERIGDIDTTAGWHRATYTKPNSNNS